MVQQGLDASLTLFWHAIAILRARSNREGLSHIMCSEHCNQEGHEFCSLEHGIPMSAFYLNPKPQWLFFSCELCHDAVTIWTMLCWMVEWLLGWKLFGRRWSWPNWGTTLAFAWRGWGNPWKTLFRISSIPAKIQTECLPHVSAEFYYYASLLCTPVYSHCQTLQCSISYLGRSNLRPEIGFSWFS
jgi:hypothetical protein